MEQIAVGSVDLDALEAKPRGALGRLDEIAPHAIESGTIEGLRDVFALIVRDRGRRFGLPAERLARRNLRAALPGGAARGFAACMTDLNRNRDRRMRPDSCQD